MKALSGTYLRFAEGDEKVLEPDGAASGILRLHDGTETGLKVIDGSVKLPSIAAPEVAEAVWLDDAGNRLYSSKVEVVSRHYFALADLNSDTDDFTAMSTERLWAARQAATEAFERNAKRCFVERLGRTRTWRGGFVELDDCDVSEVLTDGWELVSDCQCRGEFGEAVIEYRYGLPHMPARVSAAVLSLAAYYLRSPVTPERATGESTEVGFIRYSLAGRDGATGLPEVDAIIQQFGRRRYGVV